MKNQIAIRFSIALSIMAVSAPSFARMAGKFERVSFLAAALDHLSEVAHRLQDPISAIEVRGDQVIFIAGGCYVAITIEDRSAPGSTAANYIGRLGATICK